MFGYTFAGIVLAYIFVQGIGIAAGEVVSEHTAEGVRSVMGGGVLGGLALVVIALASIGSGVMNDYSGSLALQTIGVRVRRPVSAVIVTVLAFALILWLHAADTATRFQDVLLLVSYWIPAFVAVVVIDWLLRIRGRASINPAVESTDRRDAAAAVIVFVLAYAAAIPFMNTSLIRGAGRTGVARRGRRLFREFACGGGTLRRLPGAVGPLDRVGGLTGAGDEVVDQVDNLAGPFDVREVADALEHLEPAPWPRFVHGVSVVDRDDPILVAPDGHGGQLARHVQPIECAHGLTAIVDNRSQRP